jgi:hypothetical protein
MLGEEQDQEQDREGAPLGVFSRKVVEWPDFIG